MSYITLCDHYKEGYCEECEAESAKFNDTLTLRDRFAMAAMSGIQNGNSDMSNKQLRENAFEQAQVAYVIADAMLKAREDKQ